MRLAIPPSLIARSIKRAGSEDAPAGSGGRVVQLGASLPWALDRGQIAPRPLRLVPVTALTTTTRVIAPLAATTIELMSSGHRSGGC